MWSVTVCGWEIMITCEPSTSTMSALARWACDRTTSAPAALSPAATTAQDGSFFQAGDPDTSVNAAAAMSRVQDAVLGAVRDIPQVFALLRSEGGDVDQADDVRGAGRGVGNDRAAVGVADQQHRAVDLVEEAGDVGRIGGHAAQRIGRGDDGVALPLQPLDDAVPAGRVREGAVHEHDCRLDVGLFGHEAFPSV
jgi:hypothetical protein